MHIEVDRFLALTAMLAGFVPTSRPRRDAVELRGEVGEAGAAHGARALRAGAVALARAPDGADEA